MSDYSQLTDFSAKDALTPGDAEKIILGSDVDGEFSAISTAIASKEDTANKSQASGYASLDGSSLVPSQAEGGSGGELPFATETLGGVAELATTAEALALANDTKIVTPSTFRDVLDANGGLLLDIVQLNDPGADTLLGWDDSASAAINYTLGTGIDSSGTSITADPSGINHDLLAGFQSGEHIEHTSVDIIAGSGLTGGGDISADRTLNVVGGEGLLVNADDVALNIPELTGIEGNTLASADEIAIYDSSAGGHRALAYGDAGYPVLTGTAAKTFTSQQMNHVHELTGSTDRAFTLNNGIGVQGNVIVIVQSGTGSIEIDGTATVNSAVGLFTRTQHSVAVLLCLSTNTWVMFGDMSNT